MAKPAPMSGSEGSPAARMRGAAMPGAGASRQQEPHKEMTLRELVEKYRSIGGGFGRPAALAAFGQAQAGAEHLFGIYDEDYHISRFFHFSESDGQRFFINGVPVTHVTIDADVEALL